MAGHHPGADQKPASEPPGQASPPPPPGDGHPGWYLNPTGQGERYWDGAKWTQSQRGESRQGVSTLRLVLSYGAALLFPIAGLIAGILLLVRRSIGHGVVVMVIAGVWGIGAVALLPSLQPSSGPNAGDAVQRATDLSEKAVAKCSHLLDAGGAPRAGFNACINRAIR
jgi:Protein of unknown function (DUF2510)